MEKFEIAIRIGLIILSLISTGIAVLTAFIKVVKAKKYAESEQEKAAAATALNELKEQAIVFIRAAETAFKDVDAVLKTQNASAGSVKKESVMTKLQAFALEKGYIFDCDYWSKTVDDLVALTKEVNFKH